MQWHLVLLGQTLGKQWRADCKDKRMKNTKLKLIFLSLLLIPKFALAAKVDSWFGGDAWTFYSYGNGFVIAELLRAITAITTSAGFFSLFVGLAIIGFMVAGSLGVTGNFTRAAGYFVSLILVIYSTFSIKIDIYVEEQIYSAGGTNYGALVPNVPVSLGFPFVATSEIGRWISKKFEDEMTTPTNTKPPLISEGMSFGSGPGVMTELQSTRITNPYFRKNFNEYISECILPQLHTGAINASDLINSNDIWKTLELGKHPSVFIKVINLDGTTDRYNGVQSCEEGYNTMQGQITSVVNSPDWLKKVNFAGTTGKQIDELLQGIVTSIAIPTVIQNIDNPRASGLALQAGLIEMYRGTHEYAAQSLGMDSAMLAINTEQARRSQQGTWYTTAVLFRDMAGYIYAVLQAFIIGIAPFITLLLIMPGYGVGVLSSYVKVVVWMMLWWPGLTITNYIMMLYYQSEMNLFGESFNFTFANIGSASVYTDKMIMAVAFMATMIPAVMWGIVSGTAYALTSVLDRASGAGAAASAASKTSESSMSAGSVNLNNASMNKWDSSWRHNSGFEGSTSHMGAGAVTEHFHRSGQQFDTGGLGATRTTSLEAAKALNQAKATERTSGSEYSESAQRVNQQLSSASSNWTKTQGTNESGGVNISNADDFTQGMAYLSSINESLRNSDSNMDKNTRAELEKTQQQIALGLSASLTTGGAGGGLDINARDTWTKEQSAALEKVLSSDAVKALESGQSISDVMQINSKSSDGNTYSRMATTLEQGSHSKQYVDSDLLAQTQTKLDSYRTAQSERQAAEATLRASETVSATEGYNPDLIEREFKEAEGKIAKVGADINADENEGLQHVNVTTPVPNDAVALANATMANAGKEQDQYETQAKTELAGQKVQAQNKARHEALGKNEEALQGVANEIFGATDKQSMRKLRELMDSDAQVRARVGSQLAEHTENGRTYSPVGVSDEGIVYSSTNAKGGEDIFVGNVGKNSSNFSQIASFTHDSETGAQTLVVSDSNTMAGVIGGGELIRDANGNYQATGEFLNLPTNVTTGIGGAIQSGGSNLAGQSFVVQSAENWDGEKNTAIDQGHLNDRAEGERGDNLNLDKTFYGAKEAQIYDEAGDLANLPKRMKTNIADTVNDAMGGRFPGAANAVGAAATNLTGGVHLAGAYGRVQQAWVNHKTDENASHPFTGNRLAQNREKMETSESHRERGEQAYYQLKDEIQQNYKTGSSGANYSEQTVADAVAYMAYSGREDLAVMNHLNKNYLGGTQVYGGSVSAKDLFDSAKSR